MKVLLMKNVANLGQIGDVVEVKRGYARNYLLPQRLATEPTPGNLKQVEAAKAQYLAEVARLKAEMQAKAAALQGRELTIKARANEEGHLYGSVGPAQLAAALLADGIQVDADDIVLDSPIRQLDKYDVVVKFAEDVTATIHVWLVPEHDAEEIAPEGGPAEGEGSSGEEG